MADEPTIHDHGESEESDELDARPALLWQLTSPFALLIAFGFMAIALFDAWPTLIIGENGVMAEARVLSAKNVVKLGTIGRRGRPGRGTELYREIEYEFNDQKGIPYYGGVRVGYGDKPRVGDTIWIDYKADDPTLSVVAEDNLDYSYFILGMLCASCCLFWRPIVFLLNFVPFLHIKVHKVNYPPH